MDSVGDDEGTVGIDFKHADETVYLRQPGDGRERKGKFTVADLLLVPPLKRQHLERIAALVQLLRPPNDPHHALSRGCRPMESLAISFLAHETYG
ncbi:hypothetical protein OUZ56_020370 [Daphnia magna]|uniref:Uncharacterized protein n=1 Tax=Daphnia magna TaxID=35525 RepID=A0ABQ9ZEB0_9CRUS|nr:hypothetical protein OUZ56_020370 [Daphnia magna]